MDGLVSRLRERCLFHFHSSRGDRLLLKLASHLMSLGRQNTLSQQSGYSTPKQAIVLMAKVKLRPSLLCTTS